MGSSGDPFLLACRFFDPECAGYLDADDLEEIAFMVSDGISRESPSFAFWILSNKQLRKLETAHAPSRSPSNSCVCPCLGIPLLLPHVRDSLCNLQLPLFV